MSPVVERDNRVIPEFQLILVDNNENSQITERLCRLLSEIGSVSRVPSIDAICQSKQHGATRYLIVPMDDPTPEPTYPFDGYDPLTGVGNRAFLYKSLQKTLLELSSPFALVSLDIDRFSTLNHQYGQAMGDALVKALAQRLLHFAPASFVSRMGSDEFCFIVHFEPKQTRRQDVRHLIDHLLETLAPAYQIGSHEVSLFCSLGIVLAPQHHQDVDQLINYANLARTRAKHTHGHSFAIYDDYLDRHSRTTAALEPELWRALQKEEFCLYYQPRVCLKSGKIIGAEALIRWQHPLLGLILPDHFIQLCERSGLIVPLGYWIVEQAGKDIRTFQQTGLEGHVSVNLSFRQFQDDYLVSSLERLITLYPSQPQMLEFELTETALYTDEAHVIQCMKAISDLGIEFSLDDFGTGYSSFSMLQKLPISTLKIDRSFIAGIGQQADDEEIVRTLIRLGKNLNKNIIAEGVENEQQRAFLVEHDCLLGQGFYYSPPVTPAAFIQLLNQQSAATAL
ncbi:putative bifunctional diguanylate cyclase/phosphodiesterase [Nitrincola nitratireducens]|uniref:Bacteriophytochrome cph2 n=1 Tax=Nitrincola nitratireducens TaxID=1229521 RepID=W9V2V9_9GAMM|nr:bifunctional diguanylate cyclase/phosphodiesterase [Nitrincola nitratireducens]EXJ10472.1 Bacteriophytochrome cph2 [Nitrincola nitratireducens]